MPGIDVAFKVEPLGMLYALVAAGLWIPTSCYAPGICVVTVSKPNPILRLLCPGDIRGSGHRIFKECLTLFLFYEILTFSTYPLVLITAMMRRNERVESTWGSC